MSLDDRLAHLPPRKRRDLTRAVKVLFEEFEEARKGKLSDRKKSGRILKVMLYGSHARGDWVEDRISGYFSDYDLLVIVNHDDLVEDFDLWETARDRFDQIDLVRSSPRSAVSFIVHSYQDVNDQLARGRPFFVDIDRDALVLYEAEGFPLAKPGPLTPEGRNAEAWLNYDKWYKSSVFRIQIARYASSHEELAIAAFELHQATEGLFHCSMLVTTLYSPKLHALRRLRPMAEGIDRRLVEAWPRNDRLSRRRFNLLHEAYVKARYSPHYTITTEELDWLAGRIGILQRIVHDVCREHLGPRPATA